MGYMKPREDDVFYHMRFSTAEEKQRFRRMLDELRALQASSDDGIPSRAAIIRDLVEREHKRRKGK